MLAAICGGRPIALSVLAQLVGLRRQGHITKDPFLFERLGVLYVLGCAYAGDIDEAERSLDAVDIANPDVTDLVVRLAQELFQQALSRHRRDIQILAIELLAAVHRRLGTDTPDQILFALATCHYEHGRPDNALAILSDRIRRDSSDPKFLVEAGLCHAALSSAEDAEALYRQAAALPAGRTIHTERRTFHFYRGLANWLLGRTSLARRDFVDSGESEDLWYDTLLIPRSARGRTERLSFIAVPWRRGVLRAAHRERLGV
jgi:hypothetical protein